MNNDEKNKYKNMGLLDVKEELKKDWINYVKNNSKDELNFIKVKLTAISMRRLSNAFSCDKIKNFLYEFPICIDYIKEIEENICYFHKNRSEEYFNFINKKFIIK